MELPHKITKNKMTITPGLYELNEDVVFDGDKDFEVVADGVVLNFQGNQAGISIRDCERFILSGLEAKNVHQRAIMAIKRGANLYFYNLHFHHNTRDEGTSRSCPGINMKYETAYSQFVNCHIHNVGEAFYCGSAKEGVTGPHHAIIKNCKLHNLRNEGIDLKSGTADCRAVDNYIFDVGDRCGINIGGVGNEAIGNHIHTVRGSKVTAGIIAGYHGKDGTIHDNHIHDAMYGILARAFHGFISIQNNTIYNVDKRIELGNKPVPDRFVIERNNG